MVGQAHELDPMSLIYLLPEGVSCEQVLILVVSINNSIFVKPENKPLSLSHLYSTPHLHIGNVSDYRDAEIPG